MISGSAEEREDREVEAESDKPNGRSRDEPGNDREGESSNNDGVYMPSQTLEISSITCMAQEREVPHGNKGL